MGGDTYQQWVEGADISTGLPKGQIRQDEHALRFAEVVVNGPKSWSLAAGLHPDISVAYEAAQDKAVREIGRYVAANACTRVGPRGGQVQVHVDAVEMAAIRHYTSRAGDPHRHIHLQVNARVPVGDKWRGIDSAALLRMQRAINGIGHRAVAADPQFRQALAGHGYRLDDQGEIVQLAAVVPAMSKRSGQVGRNVERYDREWRADNPGAEPSAEQLRSWDARGWEDARPAKARNATRGDSCEQEWLTELRTLGVDVNAHLAAPPTAVGGVTVGSVDRGRVAARALAVLGCGARGRSTWCVYDIRGAVEEVLSTVDVVGDRAAYQEMAEDITARVLTDCQSVLEQPGIPEHIRHLTSEAVVELQQDLAGRLAVRGAADHRPASVEQVGAALARLEARRARPVRLDEGQVAAVRAVAGTGPLVFVEGAAGAGKTSMLAAANETIVGQGRQLRVVAPTRKAAAVAARETGAAAGTAAGLVHAYGFRWDTDGVWTRLAIGDLDTGGAVYGGPVEADRLRAGDVLLVDEAGMLDQQTARALLHIADETNARVVFVGDRRQLPAVGIGGVLDQVATWTPQHIELASVHRFRKNVTRDDGELVNVPDTDYAALSLQMRSGVDPAGTFDALLAGGHVQLWGSDAEALANIAVTAADRHSAGESQAVSVATNDEADLINEAVHQQLVERGLVDDAVAVAGADGLNIGVGDRVMTRRNNTGLGVANRQVWTVTAVTGDGQLEVVGDNRRQATLPADYVADKVHLAYASTTHGVQGETATHADLLLTPATDAAGVYVGLTRGRHTNTVHIVADTVDQARQQWVEAAGRDRADLGLEQARQAALAEVRNYRAAPADPPERSVDPRLATDNQSQQSRPGTAARRKLGSRGAGRVARGFADRMLDVQSELDTVIPVRNDNHPLQQQSTKYDPDEPRDQPGQTGPRL